MGFKLRKPNPKGETRVSVIHSSSITMEGVPNDVIGTDEHGNTKLMKPGKNYKFPGNKVTERKI